MRIEQPDYAHLLTANLHLRIPLALHTSAIRNKLKYQLSGYDVTFRI